MPNPKKSFVESRLQEGEVDPSTGLQNESFIQKRIKEGGGTPTYVQPSTAGANASIDVAFDPTQRRFEYTPNPNYLMDETDLLNAYNQPLTHTLGRSLKLFGANMIGAIGTSAMNSVDIQSTFDILQGKETEFESSLFGLSTTDIMEWTQQVQQNNPIYERKPGEFNPMDGAWWATQVASAGTGVGMGLYALGETAAITALTEGVGTIPNLIRQAKRLPQLMANIAKGVRTAEQGAELLNIGRNLKNTATTYAILNRLNESKMEAQQTFQTSYSELLGMKDEQGNNMFTEEEARKFAAEGAIRDFQWNLPLMALDILTYRTMVFNPISRQGTSLLDRGFNALSDKLGKSLLGRSTSWAIPKVVGMTSEGLEEGLQYIGASEGEHYARVLAGLDDGSSLLQRVGENIQDDEFWNSFAGGVIGSPIIGGFMNATNKLVSGTKQKGLEAIHKNFVENVGKMDMTISEQIRRYEGQGKFKEAETLRRSFGVNKALSALHLDALKNSNSGFESLLNFYEETLGQVQAGNTESLQDLGFFNPTEEQVQQISNEFQTYIDDARSVQQIYNKVANQYDKRFVPEITRQQFNLDALTKDSENIDNELQSILPTIPQYTQLSSDGQKVFQLINDNLAIDSAIELLKRNKDNTGSIESLQKRKQSNTEQIREINSNEGYQENTKEQDEEVINSMVATNDYLSKLLDKHYIQAQIKLQRNKLSKWNDNNYQKERLREVIDTAKDSTTLKEIKEEMTVTGDLDDSTREKLDERIQETEAEEISSNIDNPFGNIAPSVDKGMPPSNALQSRMETARGLSSSIGSITAPRIQRSGNATLVEDIDFTFEPDEINSDIPEATKEALKSFTADYVGSLAEDLRRTPTFEDFVRDYIKTQSKGAADKQYNGLVKGWQLNGFTSVDYDKVYNQIFRDRKEIGRNIGEAINNMIVSPKELQEENDKVIEDVMEKQNPPEDFDENNKPIYLHKGYRTHETQPKFAHSSRLSEATIQEVEGGNIVEYNYTSEELNQGQYVKSLKLLDFDRYREGDKLIIRIPENAQDMLVPIYNEDGTKGQAMSFADFLAKREKELGYPLTPDMQEYKDKIPMIIYDSDGDGVAFVHDIGWYNPVSFNEVSPGQMEEAIANTRNIRDEVLTSNNREVGITVTGKRETTFAGLKLDNSKPMISLNEANPQTTLVIADRLGRLKRNSKDYFENENKVIINTREYKAGRVYDVRRFGSDAQGRKTYIALRVSHPSISEDIVNSVSEAVALYLNQYNKNIPQAQRERYQNIRDQVLSTTNLDLYNAQDFNKFIKQFIPTVEVDNTDNFQQEVVNKANRDLAFGKPYISVQFGGGNIVFGITGINMSENNASFSIGPNFFNREVVSEKGLALMRNAFKMLKEDILPKYNHDVSLDALGQNKPVVMITPSGVQTIRDSYQDYIKDVLRTNIRSYNIGTDENPKWVTNTQPVITYDSDSNLNKFSQEVQQQETLDHAIPEDTVEVDNVLDITEDEIIRLQKEAEEQLRWLGDIQEEDLFDPVELTDTQVGDIIDSVTRIAGLNPSQQYSLVDYFFNQVSMNVDFDTREAIPEKELYSRIREQYNKIIVPIKEDYIERRDKLQKIYISNPTQFSNLLKTIRSYNYGISKIQSLEDNFDSFIELTKNRINKYTGITEVELENYNYNKANEEFEYEMEGEVIGEADTNERETDFSSSALQEDGKSTSSYRLKRFFAGIRDYNSKGQPKTTFLNLDVFVGFDVVFNTVSSLLAGVPADYNLMIERLKENKNNFTWIPELIDKLNNSSNQIKEEFVSTMHKHSLKMEFTMYGYDSKTGNYTLRVYSTNANSITQSIQRNWYNNFKTSPLVVSRDGVYEINNERAKYLLGIFNDWTSVDYVELENTNSITTLSKDIARVTSKSDVVVPVLEPNLKAELDNKLKTNDKISFFYKGKKYQFTKAEDGKFRISLLKTKEITPTEVKAWLSEFGITLSDESVVELMDKGMYEPSIESNNKYIPFTSMFDKASKTYGLFGSLAYQLEEFIDRGRVDIEEEGGNPLDGSIIRKLAKIESKYNTSVISNSFRDNGKSIYGFTATKYITDRVEALVNDSNLREQLSNISFSQDSLWLTLLNDGELLNKFEIIHLGLNAFKELGKQNYKDNGIIKLADADHELTKLGLFSDLKQGQVKTLVNGIEMRVGRMFSPTMSDKTTMTVIKTAVLNLKNKDLIEGQGMSDNLVKTLYEQTIRPELKRMINFFGRVEKTNISAYDKGAGMFMFMPKLNDLTYNGINLITYIRSISKQPGALSLAEDNLMSLFYDHLTKQVQSLVEEKMEVWKNNGYITYDNNGKAKSIEYLDTNYLKKFKGDPEIVFKLAAMDYVINSLIANSNSFMLIAGDPAIYYKEDKRRDIDGRIRNNTSLEKVTDSFVNVGKRLANQIAPGIKLADSNNNQYIQVFLKDRKSSASNLDYLTKLLGKEGASGYTSIEASDAQEYTTWKEHLYILEKLGRTPDVAMGVTAEEVREAREIFSSNRSYSSLNDREKKLIKQVAQPIKPVYTGQVYDPIQDVMRVVYIKSSSFPLIPQLTEGLELDNLRLGLERLERKEGKTVRASYQTANKVGSVINPVNIWNEEGNSIEDNLSTNDLTPNDGLETSSLILDRNNFRIQQDVPFKSYKRDLDTITLGTQTMKLLFGDGILNINDFNYNGETKTGKQLHEIYNNLFIDLINEKKLQLYSQLGIDPTTNLPINAERTMQKLQTLLRDEAVNRGFPKQDIESLNLSYKRDSSGEVIYDSEGNPDIQFTLPLWSSANSNRFESLLNAIVTNRLIKLKVPGYSFVVGSEEGFKLKEGLEGIRNNKIVFTSKWEGQLKPAEVIDGKLNKAQVLMPSKFRDREGKLVDLTSSRYSERDENGILRLKEEMISPELLSNTSFRIPTSGHVSMSQIEIVGFLPEESGDLLIVPKNFTQQMGLDFDIDKQNVYSLFHQMEDDGRITVLGEDFISNEDIDDFMEYYSNVKREYFKNVNIQDRIQTLEDEISSMEELGHEPFKETVKKLAKEKTKVNPNITEGDYREAQRIYNQLNSSDYRQRLLTNEIIKIHESILSNPSNEVQRKIQKTLSIDFAKEQAALIDNIINEGINNEYFTPLSDEYQKRKMFLGAAGKIGTGAYSLDVVSHSLFQQANLLGSPLQLKEEVIINEESTLVDKVYTFGNYRSTGVLGLERTLDGNRTISEVLSELQNIAVDNEKEQVMGRVNLNEITLDVSKVFALLGFDKGEDGNSIQFLFLSQPILRDYVDMMRNANSNIAGFIENKEAKVIEALYDKYGIATTDIDDNYSSLMTNKNMLAALKSDVPDSTLQGVVLQRFLDMKEYGKIIKSVQTRLNADSKGLGKSTFDVIVRRDNLNKIPSSILVENVDKLLGEFIPVENVDDPTGLFDIGNYYVRPTTLVGAFNIIGTTTAYDLWNKYFPYDGLRVREVMDEVVGLMGRDEVSDAKSIELRQDTFREMKKYLYSNRKLGLYTLTPQEERARLFIDTDTNTSLAKYLKQLRDSRGNSVVDEFIKTNKLIGKFELDVNDNGLPSIIKFNNAASESFDEEYMYNSFVELIERPLQLPDFNGRPYNTRMLSQDLISYAYLEGGVQQAIQFVKYVPVSYLHSIGFSDIMSRLDLNTMNVFGIVNKDDSTQYRVSRFAMQYAQHNPQRMPKLRLSNEQGLITSETVYNKIENYNSGFDVNNMESLTSFELKDNPSPPVFLSIYNSKIQKGRKKFQLYYYDGTKYNRIPVLGVFGMNEYVINNSGYSSLVNGYKAKDIEVQKVKSTPVETGNDLFLVNTGNMSEVMNAIVNSNIPYLSPLASALQDKAGDIKIEYKDLLTTYGRKGRGKYNPETNTIELDINIFRNLSSEDQARTILHELIHGLTVEELMKYKDSTEVPAYISRLNRLYNRALREIGQDKVDALMEKFRDKQALTPEEKRVYYGVKDIYEFVAMVMTQPEFQQEMNKIKLENGETLFDRFKQIIKSILESLGVEFDKGAITYQAIDSVFELISSSIESVNPKTNPYSYMLDITKEDLNNLKDDTDNFEPSEIIDLLLQDNTITRINC